LFTGTSMLGVYFFAPSAFSGQVVFHLPHPLTVFYYSLLFVFLFCGTVRFWMLSYGSGDQLCDPLTSLLPGVAYCLPTLSLHCLSCVCLLVHQCWDQLLAPPFSSALSVFHLPSLLCVLDYSSLSVTQFCWVGISLTRGCAGLCSQGWIREFYVVHGAHLFVLSIDTQAGLQLAAVVAVVAVAAVRNGSNFS
jgi:hypothetical protein